MSVSGTCAVTFSIVFAYVSDCTERSERSHAYGLVSCVVFWKENKISLGTDLKKKKQKKKKQIDEVFYYLSSVLATGD